ncbi:MAG: ABC transporter ATP-binding protein [Gammaproteobacteria bacterium]|nr:ABC transporter ATP-binding protein [Gammaproteobacteria bacterium]MDH3534682.1 ABC transporter ATP-binding protein [Gammaproteobacteria bacterium]
MTQALAISSLSYSVAGLNILKRLNLDLAESRYYAIAGVNGAGKSTLIRLILDLIRPAPGGSIRIFGMDNQDRQCRDQLAYLPEKFDVKKNITGRQYLDFIAAVYHQDLSRKEIDTLAERLDFPPDRLDSRVGGYSKGMVQKLGLVSCFMLGRRLIILDEPLSGLDPRARFHFKELMRAEKAAGRTILYSTHLLADAEDLCDRFGILHDGEMKYQGTPGDCLQRYHADTLEQAYMKCISE